MRLGCVKWSCPPEQGSLIKGELSQGGAVSYQIPVLLEQVPEEGLGVGVLIPSALPHIRVFVVVTFASVLGSRPGLHPVHPQLCLLQVLALGRP